MIGYQQEQRSLTKEQKQAIGLLSVGTFLEYFDLMLYVHMALLLNELFFPKADPHTTAIYSATAFCSTFVFRPIGALIFGWIGDNMGRKTTVVITTFIMALSCLTMANLPTYAQIGITASWLVTICRIMQGISSMGEVVGAKLYLTELINPPIQYPAVSSVVVFSTLGGVVALGIASLVTSYGFNWRLAFWIGTGVALVGTVARRSLRETPEFADAKRQLKKTFQQTSNVASIYLKKLENNSIWTEKANKVTVMALFLIECMWPVLFYFIYIYCGNLLKNSFDYSAAQVIHQNFIISICGFLSSLVFTYFSYKIYPLKIIKTMLLIFCVFALACPYLLNNLNSSLNVFLIQLFVVLFAPTGPDLGHPIFYRYFPIFKRFSCVSITFAISRALMYLVTSFAIVYLTEYWHHWGIMMILFPVCIGFAFGIFHFEKLEKEAGNYPQKSYVDHGEQNVV
ncbi:MFS transporter [Candidatus Tisiphia endosymbiont of Ptychoptera albimana]|uniref:MFS transporter n=1 Tax=Candidatus Tisiphia endosymbiont of Ptychoptera albimana TaxID=3066260 RepID=UPI001DE4E9C9|nr:MFS transporter [Rickettsia endosymbiont of Sericostoma sp. HW-2014]